MPETLPQPSDPEEIRSLQQETADAIQRIYQDFEAQQKRAEPYLEDKDPVNWADIQKAIDAQWSSNEPAETTHTIIPA